MVFFVYLLYLYKSSIVINGRRRDWAVMFGGDNGKNVVLFYSNLRMKFFFVRIFRFYVRECTCENLVCIVVCWEPNSGVEWYRGVGQKKEDVLQKSSNLVVKV